MGDYLGPELLDRNSPQNLVTSSISQRGLDIISKESFKIENREVVVSAIASKHVSNFVNNLYCFVTQTTAVKPLIFSIDKYFEKTIICKYPYDFHQQF